MKRKIAYLLLVGILSCVRLQQVLHRMELTELLQRI